MSLIDSDTVTANLVSRTEVREMRGRYTRLSRVSPAFACFERALNVFVSKIWMISLLTLFERERERENNARVETLNLIGQQFRRSIDRKLSYEFVLVIDERSRCSRTFLFISRKRIESYKYRKANSGIRSNRSSMYSWLDSRIHRSISLSIIGARIDECCECFSVFSLIVALLIPTRVIKNRYKECFFSRERERKRIKRLRKLLCLYTSHNGDNGRVCFDRRMFRKSFSSSTFPTTSFAVLEMASTYRSISNASPSSFGKENRHQGEES